MAAMRTPDQILADFDAGCRGSADIDMRGVLWEVLEDVMSSVELALTNADYHNLLDDVMGSVRDYLVNNYGDD